jgi:GT2 family glycosyltransferase
VILPVRNGATTIDEQLAALARQTYGGPWEVVVADNGSADATARIARGWGGRIPRLTVVEADGRIGASYARNAGCTAATGRLLLFCDADDVVSADWVAEMAIGLRYHPAVGGRIERALLNDPEAVAARPGRPDGLLDSFGFLRYPLTANSGIRRDVWSRVGGFDENYPYGSEDVVFFWRAQLAGFTLGYLPDAVVHYRLRHGSWQMAQQYFRYGTTHPQLFKDFASVGMPRSDTAEALREWGRLACRLCWPMGRRSDRAVWLTRAAMRTGRLLGSARHRVVYL